MAESKQNLATVLDAQGYLQEAEALLLEALRVRVARTEAFEGLGTSDIRLRLAPCLTLPRRAPSLPAWQCRCTRRRWGAAAPRQRYVPSPPSTARSRPPSSQPHALAVLLIHYPVLGIPPPLVHVHALVAR